MREKFPLHRAGERVKGAILFRKRDKPCWDIFYCLGRFCKSAIPGWYQYLYGLNMTFDIPMEKHRKLI